jgi:hypothetical protein
MVINNTADPRAHRAMLTSKMADEGYGNLAQFVTCKSGLDG